jgi:NADP-dependent 3-hydroxy acid dehydrogenase YdfG
MKRVALVTGASSGVGLSIARHLSERMHVIAVARRADRLREAFGGNPAIDMVPCDVADAAAFGRVLVELAARTPGIDTLINNAGIMTRAKIDELDSAELGQAFSVNVQAPPRGDARAPARHARARIRTHHIRHLRCAVQLFPWLRRLQRHERRAQRVDDHRRTRAR